MKVLLLSAYRCVSLLSLFQAFYEDHYNTSLYADYGWAQSLDNYFSYECIGVFINSFKFHSHINSNQKRLMVVKTRLLLAITPMGNNNTFITSKLC